MRNIHIPLPESLYARLKAEAERRRAPATRVAREAIDSWLSAARKVALHREIASYAAEFGGTPQDIDPALEAAGIEALLRLDAESK